MCLLVSIKQHDRRTVHAQTERDSLVEVDGAWRLRAAEGDRRRLRGAREDRLVVRYRRKHRIVYMRRIGAQHTFEYGQKWGQGGKRERESEACVSVWTSAALTVPEGSISSVAPAAAPVAPPAASGAGARSVVHVRVLDLVFEVMSSRPAVRRAFSQNWPASPPKKAAHTCVSSGAQRCSASAVPCPLPPTYSSTDVALCTPP